MGYPSSQKGELLKRFVICAGCLAKEAGKRKVGGESQT